MFMRFFNFSNFSDQTWKLQNINVNSYWRQRGLDFKQDNAS